VERVPGGDAGPRSPAPWALPGCRRHGWIAPTARRHRRRRRPLYRRVWVWSVVAAVVVSASIAIPLAVIEGSPATAFGSRLDLGAARR